MDEHIEATFGSARPFLRVHRRRDWNYAARPFMPNFLAMSFEGALAPSFDLRCLAPGHKAPDGWGIGYYPGGEPSASVLKEPAPQQGSIRGELVKAWDHLESPTFLMHIRQATWGSLSDGNTQPFSRSYGGRDWLFCHSGSLRERVEVDDDLGAFMPVGSTDTERVFCEMLRTFHTRGWRTLGDVDPAELHAFFDRINDHGTLTVVFTDGRDLCVYADRNDDRGVFVWKLLPPHGGLVFGDADLQVDLTRRGIKSRKGVLISSDPLEYSGPPLEREAPGVAPTDSNLPQSARPGHVEWTRLSPGHLLVIRQGAIRAEVAPSKKAVDVRPSVRLIRGLARAKPKRFDIEHVTTYRYVKPVERSTHILRLVPAHDRLQHVLSSELSISVNGQARDFDDVFGNRVRKVLFDAPYGELEIAARSHVEVLDVDPFESMGLRIRSTIPLVWMPWQRQILQPFLLPPELPETELQELIEYAMSFVERNDYDLLEVLFDINQTIFREYEYRQGSTSLATSAFDVYCNRRGVCQDFTNLFICLARLLGVPARYTCGYVYTGPKGKNHVQSEASHAWVQLYLPQMGWRGFDPTNGCVTQTDHVRVAVGRNYVDATPTSGTIFVGGGGETLNVHVRIEES